MYDFGVRRMSSGRVSATNQRVAYIGDRAKGPVGKTRKKKKNGSLQRAFVADRRTRQRGCANVTKLRINSVAPPMISRRPTGYTILPLNWHRPI